MPRKWVTLPASKKRSASYPGETTDPRIVANKETTGLSVDIPRGTVNDMSESVVFLVPSVGLLHLGNIEPTLGACIAVSVVL